MKINPLHLFWGGLAAAMMLWPSCEEKADPNDLEATKACHSRKNELKHTSKIAFTVKGQPYSCERGLDDQGKATVVVTRELSQADKDRNRYWRNQKIFRVEPKVVGGFDL